MQTENKCSKITTIHHFLTLSSLDVSDPMWVSVVLQVTHYKHYQTVKEILQGLNKSQNANLTRLH